MSFFRFILSTIIYSYKLTFIILFIGTCMSSNLKIDIFFGVI